MRPRPLPALALAAAATLLAAAPAGAATNSIFTLAGTTAGLSGDGGSATAARLSLAGGRHAPCPTGAISSPSRATTASGASHPSGSSRPWRARRPACPVTAARRSRQRNGPTGLALEPDGGFLIADAGNERIRRVAPNGIITTVAGTIRGLSGDGGPATSAQLDAPAAGAVLPGGGLLIADAGNGRIRRVAPSGIITTVAGTTGGFSGDGGGRPRPG